MGVSPFFKDVKCVRETEILVAQQPPKAALVCDHAGLVIHRFSSGTGYFPVGDSPTEKLKIGGGIV